MAYRIMRRLNQELEADGYITIGGRISRDYLCERLNIEDQHEKKEGVNSGKTKDV
ncbi:hypothetical protein [Anaerostipes sp.]|uniref:hypothetical protein n=1 Tax=Anaerostipes sp. TaxID=1872530 RepID=UPI0025797851|nr:hypothetical protein [Anaerostipes sp.]